MKKPIIAITADNLTEPSQEINLNFAFFAPRDLKEAVINAGGIPIILRFPENPDLVEQMVDAVLPLFDGLIIPGGPDVDPRFYGQTPKVYLGATNYLRDTYELALLKKATALKKPVFGICRGLQLMNVAFGGDIYQDLVAENPKANLIKHAQAAFGSYPTHEVHFPIASALTDIFGTDAFVNSRHHQAIKKLATGFQVLAQADDDVIEAISSTDGLLTAVQWHPENMWQRDEKQLALFENFIKKC